MDEFLLYAPWVLSAGALLLAASARVAASRAGARTVDLERAVAALRAPAPPASSPPVAGPPVSGRPVFGRPAASAPAAVPAPAARASDPSTGPCPAVLEERLGALEARLATLASTVRDAAAPDASDVAPMRPPVPSSVEPVAAPRSGWRVFP